MKQIIVLVYLLKSIFQSFVCMYMEVVHSSGTTLGMYMYNATIHTVHVHVQCHYILYMYTV